ncbi:MAG: aspartate carbamoyltransferase [Spirochaetaceae bacterium]
MVDFTSSFYGRTISVVQDLTIEEQLYLYNKTKELKYAIINNLDTNHFKINDTEFGIYLMFFESSTRTKESFRNAAKFHNVKLNNFDVTSSSFNKSESILDTIKMLYGYSGKSMFIMRTAQEGVCTFLDEKIKNYSKLTGLPKAGFINAGDGKHEHPTQEFLDEFSFLEHKDWDREEIHLALVGDLFHGRTAHSKANGLKIFKKVKIDLIAPKELAMPEEYIETMELNGFEIRFFSSIEEYLDNSSISNIWYFTRLQLERMGDKVLDKANDLRASVTFREDFISSLPEGTKFYHPLPRHSIYPVIPSFLDETPLNGWDLQSMNGYYTRIIEIALLGGAIGNDFKPDVDPIKLKHDSDFIHEIKIKGKSMLHDTWKVGIKPVDNGLVIDHIGRGLSLEEIWDLVDRVRRVMKFNLRSSHGVFHTKDTSVFKGIISIPGLFDLDEKQVKMLSAISPGCSVNIIKDSYVFRKFRLSMPPAIFNFEEISCKNINCISNKDNHENIVTYFSKSTKNKFVCKYCNKSYSYNEIW